MWTCAEKGEPSAQISRSVVGSFGGYAYYLPSTLYMKM